MAGYLFVKTGKRAAAATRLLLATKTCNCAHAPRHGSMCAYYSVMSRPVREFAIEEHEWSIQRDMSEIDLNASDAIYHLAPNMKHAVHIPNILEIQAEGPELEYIRYFMKGLVYCPTMPVNFFYGDQARSIYAHLLS